MLVYMLVLVLVCDTESIGGGVTCAGGGKFVSDNFLGGWLEETRGKEKNCRSWKSRQKSEYTVSIGVLAHFLD